jgi:drug/metabolite transporter (DMT)-like permease
VLISYTVGLVALMVVALARLEQFPPSADLIWGALAGVFGMFGLGFLLRGFATGRMGIVAPVSAVLATAIPVVFAAFTEGPPRELQLLGFGLALVSIWLLSRPERFGGRPKRHATGSTMTLGWSWEQIAIRRLANTHLLRPLPSQQAVRDVCGLVGS